jgi:hypothetical protein
MDHGNTSKLEMERTNMNKHPGRYLFTLNVLLLVFSLTLFPLRSALGQTLAPDDLYPEMDVKTLWGPSIADGDTTPSFSDFTDFGGQPVTGGTYFVTFVISNTGELDLSLTGDPLVAISGTNASDFTLTELPTTPVAALTGSTTFTVVFDPSGEGLRTATISIDNDDPDEDPYDFAIQGTGLLVPEIDVRGNNTSIAVGDNTPDASDGTDFGSTAVAGGTISQSFTIHNTGDGDLNLSDDPYIYISGDHASDFTLTAVPTTPVAPDSYTSFTIQFNPSASGARLAGLSIHSDDVNEPSYYFTIQGTGLVYPEIDVEGNGSPIPSGDISPSAADGTDFGSLSVTGATVTHTFYINNLGDGDLSLTNTPYVTITGNYASDFTVTLQPSSPVTPLGSTAFNVRFDPSGAGLRTAAIQIANNDSDESLYNFSIQGTGTVAPEMDVKGNGNSIVDGDGVPSTTDGTDFGALLVDGATLSHSFTIYNTGDGDLLLLEIPQVVISGNNAGDFTVTLQPTSPVAPAGSTTFTVQFNPNGAGLRTAELSIANNDSDENPYNFSLQGTGLAYPEIDVQGNNTSIVSGDIIPETADDTDFGSTAVAGGTVSHTFTIYNDGDGELNLTGTEKVTVTGVNPGDFTVTLQPSSPIAPDGSSTFTVVFNPIAGGVRTATVVIANDDSDENPYYFAIQGTGLVSPEIDVKGNNISIVSGDMVPELADGTDFGSTAAAGGTVTHTFTIYNTGDGELLLTGTPKVLVDGTNAADFTVTVQPSSPVAPLGSTTFTVVFNPSADGLRTAVLVIANNDSGESIYTFAIQGTGTVAPEIDVRGKGVSIPDGDTDPSTSDDTDFGSAPVAGGTVSHTFTIYNLGDADLTLSGDPRVLVGGTNAADFSVSVQPASPVAPLGSTTFTVTFDPSAAGLRTATLSITNNDSDEGTYNFAIQGTGTVFPEMEVKGNDILITDGDDAPELADGTDFGGTLVLGGTVSHSFTIYNTGDGELLLTGTPKVTFTGGNAADFSVSLEPTSPVAPDSSTTFTVVFNPSAGGLRTTTLSIANSDSDENPYNFTIQGTGMLAPEMDVRGNGVSIPDDDAFPDLEDGTDFGSTAVAGGTASHTFTIYNLGDATLSLSGDPRVAVGGAHAADFSVTAQPGSTVAPGGSTTFTVTFNPIAGGLRTATLSIANNDSDENPYNFAIQGTGLVYPEMDVKGNNISIADGDSVPSTADHTDFGSVPVLGVIISHTFTIYNTGDGALNLSGTPRVAVSGANLTDFSVTVQPVSPVAPGGSATFTVVFNPSAVGLRTATLSITNNDTDENPYNFNIQGTGLATPEIELRGAGLLITDGDSVPSLDDGTDFGSLSVASGTVSHTFTINNIGDATLELTGTTKVAVSGTNAADFTVSVQPSSPVLPGGSATFTVVFNPSGGGLRTAALSIANTDANENPYNFSIQGTGVNPPAAFNKLTPANGATDVTTSPLLTWSASTQVVAYEYCYDTTPDNACTTWISNGTSTSVGLSGLSSNTTYYWHVRAVNIAGTTYSDGLATAFFNFTTGWAVSPDFYKSAPLDGAIDQPLTLTLTWTVSQGALSYEYCMDTTDDGACSTWINVGAVTSVVLSGLREEMTYYWQVRAVHSGNVLVYADGASTSLWSFTTGDYFLTTYLPLIGK